MRDLTVSAIPFFFGTMGAEYLYLRQTEGDRAEQYEGVGEERSGPAGRYRSAGLYERRDTLTSLAMGVGSLAAPLLAPRLLAPLVPGRGRYGRVLCCAAAAAAAVTTLADRRVRRVEEQPDRLEEPLGRPGEGELARRIASAGGVASVVLGGVGLTTFFASRTTKQKMWERRLTDLGDGTVALGVALVGWDLIYYWNHRLMHQCRAMWAIHVVHHSSERYNLSTALRQPVADAFGAFLPDSLLSLLGVRPSLVMKARGINLIYQFWIHTEAVGSLGPAETVLNTPSHHRVHHGSNGKYLDKNHGGILIAWDRLFGTFQAEEEPVRYGLTKNIDTFNPLRVATHEYAAMLRDVARAQSWRDRLSFVLRGPGWAARRRAELGLEESGAECSPARS